MWLACLGLIKALFLWTQGRLVEGQNLLLLRLQLTAHLSQTQQLLSLLAAHVHTHTHTHTHTNTHTHTHTPPHTHNTHTLTRTITHTHTHTPPQHPTHTHPLSLSLYVITMFTNAVYHIHTVCHIVVSNTSMQAHTKTRRLILFEQMERAKWY